jgi:hypothetical protein
MDCVDMAEERGKTRAHINAVMNCRFHNMRGNSALAEYRSAS